ncbi:MAG: outer membrane beta-barrel domain-containing protein [Polyangiaceae bacterium]|nr:outer membrane beta-barrel domain-containing protein [Polyangiaceae bacterium]
MNKARVGLLVAAALLAAPLTASAQPKKDQPKEINLDEEETPAGGDAAGDGSTTPVEGGEGGEGAGEGDGDGGLGDICKIDPDACPSINMAEAAKRPINAEMYAVQQIYALRRFRFEINPYFGLTMNDQFVAHNGPGLALNFYINNVMAVGINGNFYAGLNAPSNFNFQTSRAARVGIPITEYAWNANANFTYVPAYGKFAGFGDFIFHYDLYVLGGVGAIASRPIAVVDPDNRTFEYKPRLSFHVGGGLRIFLNRWFAVVAELSDYIFFDELENPTIVTGRDTDGIPFAQKPETWTADQTSFTNNVQAQVGFSVFLPFTWEYRLPK